MSFSKFENYTWLKVLCLIFFLFSITNFCFVNFLFIYFNRFFSNKRINSGGYIWFIEIKKIKNEEAMTFLSGSGLGLTFKDFFGLVL